MEDVLSKTSSPIRSFCPLSGLLATLFDWLLRMGCVPVACHCATDRLRSHLQHLPSDGESKLAVLWSRAVGETQTATVTVQNPGTFRRDIRAGCRLQILRSNSRLFRWQPPFRLAERRA